MHVCIVQFSLVFSLIKFNTYNYCKRAQAGSSHYRWGPSGVLRPLTDTSESVNQCDLGIEIERGVTLACILTIAVDCVYLVSYIYCAETENIYFQ